MHVHKTRQGFHTRLICGKDGMMKSCLLIEATWKLCLEGQKSYFKSHFLIEIFPNIHPHDHVKLAIWSPPKNPCWLFRGWGSCLRESQFWGFHPMWLLFVYSFAVIAKVRSSCSMAFSWLLAFIKPVGVYNTFGHNKLVLLRWRIRLLVVIEWLKVHEWIRLE